MNQALVDRIVHAVLYEGYILYPYRASIKNRQRWTFGGLVPRAYSDAHQGSDPWLMQTECLLRGGPTTRLTVTVRFLHPRTRLVGELTPPLDHWPAEGEPSFCVVESLSVAGQLWHTWREAEERQVPVPEISLDEVARLPRQHDFHFAPWRTIDPLAEPTGQIPAVLVREQQALHGRLELSAIQLEPELFRLTVRILNQTQREGLPQLGRDDVMLHSLASTHTLLHAQNGELLSLTDPPQQWQTLAEACQNIGTWPVLVGEPGETDTVLSSPIILYDYPEIAPESPGDLFDATEIDEMLTLRVLTLTAEEKQSMATVDGEARAILDRTEQVARDRLMSLHGAMRGLRPFTGED